MKEILISIIIPVYNVENKINRLLNSLYCIKNKDIEIIFVNNNSTDNSLNIIKDYSQKDKRVKIYNEFKKGANYARLKGFNESNGKYIYFVDSDDFIETNSFKKIINLIIKKEPDIIIGNYNELNENYEFIKKMYAFGKNNILLYKPCLWDKIFKKEIIKKEDFIFDTIGEDMYLTLPVIARSKRIEYIDDSIYNYVKNENGLSSKNNYEILNNSINTLYKLKNRFIELNIYNNNIEEISYILITHSLYRAFKGILLKNKQEKNSIRNKVLKLLKEINYKNNKYYKKSFIYKTVNLLISSKILYNSPLTKSLVNLLFNNKLFNKILKKLDK